MRDSRAKWPVSRARGMRTRRLDRPSLGGRTSNFASPARPRPLRPRRAGRPAPPPSASALLPQHPSLLRLSLFSSLLVGRIPRLFRRLLARNARFGPVTTSPLKRSPRSRRLPLRLVGHPHAAPPSLLPSLPPSLVAPLDQDAQGQQEDGKGPTCVSFLPPWILRCSAARWVG